MVIVMTGNLLCCFQKRGIRRQPEPRYHRQLYVNGTLCDLTNKPRNTEVRVCFLRRGVMYSLPEKLTNRGTKAANVLDKYLLADRL